MMFIPKLRLKPRYLLDETISAIEQALSLYERHVVFADLNLNMNVLWVTVRPVPGICLVELPAAIRARVPEALLVAHKLRIE